MTSQFDIDSAAVRTAQHVPVPPFVAGGTFANGPAIRKAPIYDTRRIACDMVLAVGDAAVLLSVAAVLSSWSGMAGLFPSLLIAAAAFILLNYAVGLYPGDRLYPQEVLARRAVATLGAVLLAAVLSVEATQVWHAAPWSAAYVVLCALVQIPLRKGLRRGLHRAGLWGTPTDFIGPAAQVAAVAGFFQRNWRLGLRPVRPASGEVATLVALTQMPDTFQARTLQRQYPEALVLADAPLFPISGLSAGGGVGVQLGGRTTDGIGVVKRLFDLLVTLPVLLMAAPLMLLGALAIWIVDPGPVLYRQAREGYRGQPLRIWKLRTMYQDADQRLRDLLARDPAARAEWEAHFKLRNDPRVLPWVGAFLRASSIDELPQFLNVLMGEMSVVGPRPFPDYHLSAMPPEFRARRCEVVPGITGLWQISARSDADLKRQQQLDEYYIDNRSFWLDLQIVLGTLPAVLGRRGAY